MKHRDNFEIFLTYETKKVTTVNSNEQIPNSNDKIPNSNDVPLCIWLL